MTDPTSPPDWALRLDGFLDAVAARQPTPGGGSVAGAAGALACALARMVAAYSTTKKNDPSRQTTVSELTAHLERADRLFRGLITEDARAYRDLTAAAARAKRDPNAKSDHDTALRVAIAVPMQMAAAACETLSLLDRLLPVSSPYLVSDLAVAAVLAEAAARAASKMVRVNAALLDDDTTRTEIERHTLQLIENARNFLGGIESRLNERL